MSPYRFGALFFGLLLALAACGGGGGDGDSLDGTDATATASPASVATPSPTTEPPAPVEIPGTILFAGGLGGSAQEYTVDLVGPGEETGRPLLDTADTEPDVMDSFSVWSPDGSQIAFTRIRQTGASPELYIANADGSDLRRIEANPPAFFPAWSPDGSQITYSAYPDETGEIYTIDAAGGTPRALTATADSDDVFPSWSPDGRFLAYLSHPHGPDPEGTALSELRMVTVDGAVESVLAAELFVEPFVFSAPEWRPEVKGSAMVESDATAGTAGTGIMALVGSVVGGGASAGLGRLRGPGKRRPTTVLVIAIVAILGLLALCAGIIGVMYLFSDAGLDLPPTATPRP